MPTDRAKVGSRLQASFRLQAQEELPAMFRLLRRATSRLENFRDGDEFDGGAKPFEDRELLDRATREVEAAVSILRSLQSRMERIERRKKERGG